MKPFDEHEYHRIVEEYSDMIYKIAYQNLWCREDAEDVVQDVFLRLIKSAKKPANILAREKATFTKNSFSDSERLKAWLIRVTINRCLDIKKSFYRQNTVPLEEWDAAYEPEEQDVLAILHEMQEDDRNVLYLYYYEQYTIKEIAKILGKKQNTVNSRLNRARRRLKQLMEEG